MPESSFAIRAMQAANEKRGRSQRWHWPGSDAARAALLIKLNTHRDVKCSKLTSGQRNSIFIDFEMKGASYAFASGRNRFAVREITCI